VCALFNHRERSAIFTSTVRRNPMKRSEGKMRIGACEKKARWRMVV
jgi:hypothetical protein